MRPTDPAGKILRFILGLLVGTLIGAFILAIVSFIAGCISTPVPPPLTPPVLPPVVAGANISAIANLGWMISLLVALFVVGVVLLGLRQIILGGALVLGASAGVILAIAIAKYAWLVGIVGAIALSAGAIVVGRKLWVNYWTTREAVRAAEEAKIRLTPADKETVFGKGHFPALTGIANMRQAPAVKKEIKKIRQKLGFTK